MRTLDNFGRELDEDFVDEHIQSQADQVWVIPHGRGRKILATVFDESGQEILTDVDQGDLNTAYIRWNYAARGRVLFK